MHLVSRRAQFTTWPSSFVLFLLHNFPKLTERESACEGIQLTGYKLRESLCIKWIWPILRKLELRTEEMIVWNGSERKIIVISEIMLTIFCHWLIGNRFFKSHFREQIFNRLKSKVNANKHVWYPQTCQNPVRNAASGALDREAVTDWHRLTRLGC